MLTPDFTRVLVDGRPYWRHALTGRTFPVVSGGADGDDDDGDAGDAGLTGGDPDDGEDGEAAKPPADHAAEAAKWRAMARKHEAAAKANAAAVKELDELKNAGKSEAERQAQMIADLKASEKAARVKALKLEVAATKGLTPELAHFLPDLDDEVDMLEAADKLLAASGSTDTEGRRQGTPKSKLTNPLSDGDDAADQQARLLNAMLGKAV